MNINQKILLIIFTIILFLMLLIPPFHIHRSGVTFRTGFYLIFAPPEYYSLNIGMLFVQYLFVTTIGGILYFVLKDKNGKKRFDKTKDGSELPENSEKENMINE